MFSFSLTLSWVLPLCFLSDRKVKMMTNSFWYVEALFRKGVEKSRFTGSQMLPIFKNIIVLGRIAMVPVQYVIENIAPCNTWWTHTRS